MVFQAEKSTSKAGIFGEGLLSLLGCLLVAMKTRAMKREKKQLHCSLLLNALFSKLTLRGVYNKPVTVQGNVHWLFIALALGRDSSNKYANAHLPVQ